MSLLMSTKIEHAIKFATDTGLLTDKKSVSFAKLVLIGFPKPRRIIATRSMCHFESHENTYSAFLLIHLSLHCEGVTHNLCLLFEENCIKLD